MSVGIGLDDGKDFDLWPNMLSNSPHVVGNCIQIDNCVGDELIGLVMIHSFALL